MGPLENGFSSDPTHQILGSSPGPTTIGWEPDSGEPWHPRPWFLGWGERWSNCACVIPVTEPKLQTSSLPHTDGLGDLSNWHGGRHKVSFLIETGGAFSLLSSFKCPLQWSYFKSWKMILWKCCTQYTSKFEKLSRGHRTGKDQFSFQSERKVMQKNAPTTTHCTHPTC